MTGTGARDYVTRVVVLKESALEDESIRPEAQTNLKSQLYHMFAEKLIN